MLGELYSSAFTCAAFNWNCSPAVTELETIVLDWLCNLLNLPPCYLSTSPTGGGGVIQGSASEAIVTVLVAARDRYLRWCVEGVTDEKEKERIIGEKRSKLVALGSTQVHSSTQKAALIAGTRFATVEVDGEYKLRGKALREKIRELREEGLEPFFLTCTLGMSPNSVCRRWEVDGETPGVEWDANLDIEQELPRPALSTLSTKSQPSHKKTPTSGSTWTQPMLVPPSFSQNTTISPTPSRTSTPST